MTSAAAIPVTRLGPNLLVTLRGNLDDEALLSLEAEATAWVVRTGATGVLVDVSGLTVVDSFMARVIARVAAMIQLLGAAAVVVGIQPAVAMTMVELGFPMDQVPTALNVEQGIARLRRLNG